MGNGVKLKGERGRIGGEWGWTGGNGVGQGVGQGSDGKVFMKSDMLIYA